MEIYLRSWLALGLIISYGAICTIDGWQMYRHKKARLFVIEKAALLILEATQGEKAAQTRKRELLAPQRINRLGFYRLILGSLSVATGISLMIILLLAAIQW